jgi:hypothetical protein
MACTEREATRQAQLELGRALEAKHLAIAEKIAEFGTL